MAQNMRRAKKLAERFALSAPVARPLRRSVLELSSVQPATLEDYLRRLGWFKDSLDRQGGQLGHRSLDEAATLWFDLLRQKGHSANDGSKFPAAPQHLWPELRAQR